MEDGIIFSNGRRPQFIKKLKTTSTFWILEDDLSFMTMEDDFKYLKIEDDLNFLKWKRIYFFYHTYHTYTMALFG
jgi:hypothetical protein